MTIPPRGYDKQRLHELASAVFEGTADESELRELTDLLRDSIEAQDEYLKLVDLHAVLATELVAPAPISAQDAGEDHPQLGSVTPNVRRRVAIMMVATLAACLLIAVTWLRSNDSNTEQKTFATVAQGTDAVWEAGAVVIGDRVGSTSLRLRSGLIRIEFDSGVEVTLEGPAEFGIVDVTQTRLISGVLTATVPPGAEGFTVDTPSAQVVDLGTSFGIDVGDDGFSKVAVFDGEVEIAPRDTTEKRLLIEGESVRIGANYEVEEITFDPRPYERLWPTASGIEGSTETIRFVPPWPKQIRFVQGDDQIFVRAEGPPVRLSRELRVNISEPSDCFTIDDLTPSTLQADRFVRSYILHHSPETKRGPRLAQRVTGSITFARPIVGVIVLNEELAASSRRFGRRGAGEANQRRELNLTGDPTGDRISLSEDRKTLTLDLIAPGRSSDLIRVIVENNRRGPRTNHRHDAPPP